MTLSEQQIEKAARELCRLRGQDPDKAVRYSLPPNPDGSVPDVMLYASAWRSAAGEVIDRLNMDAAIDAAKESQDA